MPSLGSLFAYLTGVVNWISTFFLPCSFCLLFLWYLSLGQGWFTRQFFRSVVTLVLRDLAGDPVLMLVSATALVFWSYMFITHLYYEDGNVFTASSTYGDLPFHLAMTYSFVSGKNQHLPLTHVIMAGKPLAYPIVPNFHSATLVGLGWGIARALWLPSTLLGVSLTCSVYFLGCRFLMERADGDAVRREKDEGRDEEMAALNAEGAAEHSSSNNSSTSNSTSNSNSTSSSHDLAPAPTFVAWGAYTSRRSLTAPVFACVGVLVWQFGAGMGFVPFLQKYFASDTSMSHLLYSVNPTSLGLSGQPVTWWSLLGDVLLPQRSSLFSYSLCVPAMMLWWICMDQPAERTAPMLTVIGVLLGLVPLSQAHAFAAMAAFFASAMLLHRPPQGWLRSTVATALRILVPCLVVAAPQLLYYRTMIGADKDLSIRLSSLWTAQPGGTPLGLADLWAAPTYFVEATGVAGIVSCAAVLTLEPKQRRFYAGSLGMLLFSSVIMFTPWALDNLKLVFLWLPVAGAASARLFQRAWGAPRVLGPVKAVLILACVLAMTASGLIRAYKEAVHHDMIFARDDVVFGEYLRANTPHDAVFLTGAAHTHPVPALAGRSVVLGYHGWIWTHGYGAEMNLRNNDVGQMFRPETPRETRKALLQKYSVDYVCIGNEERASWRAERTHFLALGFKEHPPTGPWQILEAPAEWQSTHVHDG
jgi:hypothetical protein